MPLPFFADFFAESEAGANADLPGRLHVNVRVCFGEGEWLPDPQRPSVHAAGAGRTMLPPVTGEQIGWQLHCFSPPPCEHTHTHTLSFVD